MTNLLALEDLNGMKRGKAIIEYRRDPEDGPGIPDREYMSEMKWRGDRITIVDCYGEASTSTFGQIGLDEYGITWRCWRTMPTEEERKAGWDD